MTDTPAAPARPKPRVPRRLLRLCVVVAFGFLFGFVNVSEAGLRTLRLKLQPHAASGRIAIVDVDDKSLAQIGKWPIPRGVYAATLDRLFALGARNVYFDFELSARQDPREDARLAASIETHSGHVFLPGRVMGGHDSDELEMLAPPPAIRGVAPVLNMSFRFDDTGSVYRLPYAVMIGGTRYDSMAPAMAGTSGPAGDEFVVDPGIRLSTVPRVSLADLLAGRVRPDVIAGRNVVLGSTSEQVQNIYQVPPYGRIGTVYLQAIGAETLLQGVPHDLGFVPGMALALLLVFGATYLRSGYAMAVTALAALLFPLIVAFLPGTIHLAVVPGMAMLLLVSAIDGVRLVREALRRREQVNRVSGLLNLTALRQLPDQPESRLVVAHIQNFAEAIATLPASAESNLIAQVAARLKLGMNGTALYHGDNGVFAWFAEETTEQLGERLDGLHALFRSPVVVGTTNVDLSVTFGIDDDGERSVANRLGSALVASTEAAAEGTRWRAFDKAKLADAAWKLSLLSQLDAAIDDGHLWVAYQPQLDLTTQRLLGAEALVRWTHPEKGAISPLEFVPAAEQSNRIERLTAHVLERAVLAAATINAHEIPFAISVNLSARLLENRDIVTTVSEALATNKLDPALLTLEITETATIANGASLDVLTELRALGVRISIDDYGTGLSTLDYLKKVPASEIKIDKSFVQAMMTSTSDLLMVNSTIQLAHSLGHVVVAEGVETDEVLARLREMECDIAQGYRIGRPMTFQDLARRLLAERKRAA